MEAPVVFYSPAQHASTASLYHRTHVRAHLAGLYSLIATCEATGVNPVDYLADVLLRVQTHSAARIDELLPHKWTPTQHVPST
jgi:transposase IS66-like protein